MKSEACRHVICQIQIDAGVFLPLRCIRLAIPGTKLCAIHDGRKRAPERRTPTAEPEALELPFDDDDKNSSAIRVEPVARR
jgi:hypothetical protein